MRHQECGGAIYHDRLYKNSTFIDLVCFDCKNRWHVDRKNAFAKWVLRNDPYDDYNNQVPTACDCPFCQKRRALAFSGR